MFLKKIFLSGLSALQLIFNLIQLLKIAIRANLIIVKDPEALCLGDTKDFFISYFIELGSVNKIKDHLKTRSKLLISQVYSVEIHHPTRSSIIGIIYMNYVKEQGSKVMQKIHLLLMEQKFISKEK